MRYIDAYKLRKLIKSHESIDKALALTLVNSTHTEKIPQKYGEWKLSKFNGKWICPFCADYSKIPTYYCGYCGARLRCWWETEDKEEEDETTV